MGFKSGSLQVKNRPEPLMKYDSVEFTPSETEKMIEDEESWPRVEHKLSTRGVTSQECGFLGQDLKQ